MENNDSLLVNPVLLENAERLFMQRLATDPDNPTTLRALSDLSRKQGKLDKATEFLGRLLQVEPSDEQARYMYEILTGGDIPTLPGMRPAPFCLIKNFLPQDLHESLHPYIVSVQDQFIQVLTGDGVYDPRIRDTLELQGHHDFKNQVFAHVEKILPTIMSQLKIAPFEIEKTEVKLRAYRDGHYFRPHMDNPKQHAKICNRVLTYVYFFYVPPRPYTGGDLIIFDTDVEKNDYTTRSFTALVPENNSIVFFPSENWHCVTPIHCFNDEFGSSRFVINGHVHRRVPDDSNVGEVATAGAT